MASITDIILNAGITRDNTFVGLSDEEWFDVIDVNLNGFLQRAKASFDAYDKG